MLKVASYISKVAQLREQLRFQNRTLPNKKHQNQYTPNRNNLILCILSNIRIFSYESFQLVQNSGLCPH